MNSCSEALNTCLQWVAESKLKQPVDVTYGSGDTSNRENDVTVEVTNERAFKVYCSYIYHIITHDIYHTFCNPSSILALALFLVAYVQTRTFTQELPI